MRITRVVMHRVRLGVPNPELPVVAIGILSPELVRTCVTAGDVLLDLEREAGIRSRFQPCCEAVIGKEFNAEVTIATGT